MDNPLRQNFFRAGHAHAGVLIILALVCQVLADGANLPPGLLFAPRLGVPVRNILMPAGFFLFSDSTERQPPGKAVALICIGALVLAATVLTLGIGLLL